MYIREPVRVIHHMGWPLNVPEFVFFRYTYGSAIRDVQSRVAAVRHSHPLQSQVNQMHWRAVQKVPYRAACFCLSLMHAQWASHQTDATCCVFYVGVFYVNRVKASGNACVGLPRQPWPMRATP